MERVINQQNGPESILSLYILTLIGAGRIDPTVEPTREGIQAEITKDLGTLFDGYEAAKAAQAQDVIVIEA